MIENGHLEVLCPICAVVLRPMSRSRHGKSRLLTREAVRNHLRNAHWRLTPRERSLVLEEFLNGWRVGG